MRIGPGFSALRLATAIILPFANMVEYGPFEPSID